MNYRELMSIELKDDDKPYGGTSNIGETLEDFLNTVEAEERQDIYKINEQLIECGIQPITEDNYMINGVFK